MKLVVLSLRQTFEWKQQIKGDSFELHLSPASLAHFIDNYR